MYVDFDTEFRSLLRAYRHYRHGLPEKQVDLTKPFTHECQMRLDGRYCRVMEVIFYTTGCSWFRRTGGCFMCSLSVGGCHPSASGDNVLAQLQFALDRIELERFDAVGIYPFSSFDEQELPADLRREVYRRLRGLPNSMYILFESRPEFINEEVLSVLTRELPEKQVVIYMGVETQDDFVRKYCLNKGFSWSAFAGSVELIHRYGARAGAFLLLKPPFLSEYEALQEATLSTRRCLQVGVDTIDLRCVEVAQHSLTDILYELGEYSPAWHWTLFEVVSALSPTEIAKVTVSGPSKTDLTSPNVVPPFSMCPHCSDHIEKIIDEFNVTGSTEKMKILECACRSIWLAEIERSRLLPDLKIRLPEKIEAVTRMLESRCLSEPGQVSL